MPSTVTKHQRAQNWLATIPEDVSNKFDYSKVTELATLRDYVTVTCKQHKNTFSVRADKHIHQVSHGCEMCDAVKRTKRQTFVSLSEARLVWTKPKGSTFLLMRSVSPFWESLRHNLTYVTLCDVEDVAKEVQTFKDFFKTHPHPIDVHVLLEVSATNDSTLPEQLFDYFTTGKHAQENQFNRFHYDTNLMYLEPHYSKFTYSPSRLKILDEFFIIAPQLSHYQYDTIRNYGISPVPIYRPLLKTIAEQSELKLRQYSWDDSNVNKTLLANAWKLIVSELMDNPEHVSGVSWTPRYLLQVIKDSITLLSPNDRWVDVEHNSHNADGLTLWGWLLTNKDAQTALEAFYNRSGASASTNTTQDISDDVERLKWAYSVFANSPNAMFFDHVKHLACPLTELEVVHRAGLLPELSKQPGYEHYAKTCVSWDEFVEFAPFGELVERLCK